MAFAYVAYSEDYLPEQERAHAARLGLWRGSFEMPWDWRAERRDGRQPPDVTVEDVAAVSSDAACAIKGNISGAGRIYHMPGSATYERTRIEEADGERWFCTREEAEAAGWRPAR
jgi:hypothetical protein